MATIVTRAAKGSPLTHDEVDLNFTNLNTDKVETSAIGTAAAANTGDFATAAQGTLADSALQDITGESIQNLSDVASMTPSDGQALVYGSGVWSAADMAGGIAYTRHTANVTMAANEGVIADTSGGAFTVTLPASPAVGDTVVITDGADWATINLTVGRNGSTIEGDAADMTMNIGGVAVQFTYDGTTWQIYTQLGAAGGNVVSEGDSPTFNAVTATAFAGDGSALTGLPAGAFRNAIINGNFDHWQRGTSASINTYGSDRWLNQGIGNVATQSRQAFALGQTDVPNEPEYFCRTVVSSVAGAGNFSSLTQPIEGVRTFAGQTVTVSFYAKADSSKNIALELEQIFGSGGSPSAGVTSIGVTTLNLTTAWQKFTATVSVPSIAGKTIGTGRNDRLEVRLWFDSGSDFNTRNNSLGQQSGTFDIAQVQLEAGSVATPFDRRSVGTELALCQRYYQAFGAGAVGVEENATQADFGITFNTPMRTTPSTSLRQSNIFVRVPSLATDRTMTSSISSATAIGPRGGWLYLDISGGVAGRVIIERVGATIGFADAEL